MEFYMFYFFIDIYLEKSPIATPMAFKYNASIRYFIYSRVSYKSSSRWHSANKDLLFLLSTYFKKSVYMLLSFYCPFYYSTEGLPAYAAVCVSFAFPG